MAQDNNEAWRVVVVDHERSFESFTVGTGGVTKINIAEKSGEYSMIPYVEVWADTKLVFEVSQHKCAALYWSEPPRSTVEDLPF